MVQKVNCFIYMNCLVSIHMMHQNCPFLKRTASTSTVRWMWFDYSINGN